MLCHTCCFALICFDIFCFSYVKNTSNTVYAKTDSCTSLRSWGRSITLNLRRGITFLRYLLCASQASLFYPYNSFFFFFKTHFADKKSKPGQCHAANKRWRDLNTDHLILSAFTTCFHLLYMTWAFFSSLCCLHFCLILKNNFRNRMNKNNLLIFLWPPAVIMRLGVSCKDLLQFSLCFWPISLSSFDLWQISCIVIFTIVLEEWIFISHKDVIQKHKWGLSLKRGLLSSGNIKKDLPLLIVDPEGWKLWPLGERWRKTWVGLKKGREC